MRLIFGGLDIHLNFNTFIHVINLCSMMLYLHDKAQTHDNNENQVFKTQQDNLRSIIPKYK